MLLEEPAEKPADRHEHLDDEHHDEKRQEEAGGSTGDQLGDARLRLPLDPDVDAADTAKELADTGKSAMRR
jgi:hypothetical protein